MTSARQRPADALLRSSTSSAWAPQAVDQLELVLMDHAHCEKKAAASALALINDYPEDTELVHALGHLAEEEVGHFRQVHERLRARGAALGRDGGDPYARALLKLVRPHPRDRKVDRLLVCALIEARSCERFRLLREELARRGEAELAAWYRHLESSEAGHGALFVRLAEGVAGVEEVGARLAQLAAEEATIVGGLPLAPRVH